MNKWVLFFVLCVAVIMLASRHLTPMLAQFVDARYGHVGAGLITLVLILPLIWAMSIRRIKRAAYRHLWLNKKQLRGPLVAIEVARLVVAVLVLGLLVNQFFSTGWAFRTFPWCS
ncbi:MAG: hypothetical protein H6592_15170 [Flavobacteriales bacterium]|nr:hypothetical protein [Flavobacteriales bacterium]